MVLSHGQIPSTELPPAPVYRPSPAEFSDPLAYIDSIRAEAERTKYMSTWHVYTNYVS